MRILTASIVIGPLLLIGALPAAAGSAFAPGSSASVRLAAGDDTTDRDTYAHEAQDQMQEWQRKLHEFGEKTETTGKAAGTAAGNDLDTAWTKAEAASRKLQSVGAEGWESAKSSYEEASHELAETWHKAHPEEK
jgi:hypothetical protein